jgi:hypothetical protein
MTTTFKHASAYLAGSFCLLLASCGGSSSSGSEATPATSPAPISSPIAGKTEVTLTYGVLSGGQQAVYLQTGALSLSTERNTQGDLTTFVQGPTGVVLLDPCC